MKKLTLLFSLALSFPLGTNAIQIIIPKCLKIYELVLAYDKKNPENAGSIAKIREKESTVEVDYFMGIGKCLSKEYL